MVLDWYVLELCGDIYGIRSVAHTNLICNNTHMCIARNQLKSKYAIRFTFKILMKRQ